MRVAPMLPTRLRVGLLQLQSSLSGLRQGGARELRPVTRSRHTAGELRAFAEAAAVERQTQRDAATGRRTDVAARMRSLRLAQVTRPTADAVTLTFEVPPEDPVRFRPGQFMTLHLQIDGQEVRRAYSFCSDPEDAARVSITVKRVAGGRASTWLAENARPGMTIRALGPSGGFGTAPREGAARRVILVAGGSGITPLMAIARSLLARETQSRVELVYGNRRWEDVIFREELGALATAHPAFSLRHVLEEAHPAVGGPRGRLAGALLDEALPVDPAAEYYLCGPDGMMEAVIAHLRGRGVPDAQVRMERFTAPTRVKTSPSTGATHSVQLARTGALVHARDTETVLEAATRAGIPMEFSCTFGGCGACRVRLKEGEVEMDEPNCLTEAERGAGEILACVARARSPLILDV